MTQNTANYRDITSMTKGEFEKFKALYNECEDDGIFKFKDIDVFKVYAKYLIEYLEPKFGEL